MRNNIIEDRQRCSCSHHPANKTVRCAIGRLVINNDNLLWRASHQQRQFVMACQPRWRWSLTAAEQTRECNNALL